MNELQKTPDAFLLAQALQEELEGKYVVSRNGENWILTSRRTNREVKLEFAVEELAEYVIAFEEKAFEILGVEPRWKSAIAMIVVYIEERVAMLPLNKNRVVFVNGRFVGADSPVGD